MDERQVPRDLSSPWQIGREYRCADRTRLEDRARQTLPCRRKNHQVGTGQPRHGVVHFADEGHAIRDARGGRGASHLLSVVANLLSDEPELNRRALRSDTPKHLNQSQLVLEGLHRRHIDDRRLFGPGIGGEAQPVRADAVVDHVAARIDPPVAAPCRDHGAFACRR